jgi:sugar-specific transcriptional regulator TrmB
MSRNEHRTRAIDSLESLGLREYEAKCFVALAQLSEGTAKEVSKAASVPRTRVYDSLERLQDRGLVDVRGSNPREYRGVPVETAVRTLENEFEAHLDTVSDNLSEIQAAAPRDDDELWTVSGGENVSARGDRLVERADREVLVVLPESQSVSERSMGWIQRALERDVATLVDAATPEQRTEVETTAPDARVFVSDRRPSTGSTAAVATGRTLLVDGRSVLLSAAGTTAPPADGERAIVSEGRIGGRIASLVGEVSHARRDSTTGSGASDAVDFADVRDASSDD